MDYTFRMTYELITTWSDYQNAIDRVLERAGQRLWISDPDLVRLDLQQPARLARLRQLLQGSRSDGLRIVLRDARHLRDRSPRLTELLRQYSHCMSVVETSPDLARLRDCMLLADEEHALIRFDQEQARSKLITDDRDQAAAYFNRFSALWQEGGTPVSGTTLGL